MSDYSFLSDKIITTIEHTSGYSDYTDHGNIPHQDEISHNDESHEDHSDDTSEPHTDWSNHENSHSDVGHIDASNPHTDCTCHGDAAPYSHSDWNNAYCHTDGQTLGSHADTYHYIDNAGSGSHNDWTDVVYSGNHTDHSDSHTDSHSDSSSHNNTAYQDYSDHSDIGHNDYSDHTDQHSDWNDRIDVGDK